MIRALLGLLAVAVAVCAWIVYRPAPAPVAVEVTRAGSSDDIFPAMTADTADGLRAAAVMLDRLGPEAVAARADGRETDTVAIAEPAPAPVTETVAAPSSTEALKVTLIQAFAEGRGDAEIGAILSRATHTPGIEIPETLITAQGRIDLAPYREGAIAD